MADVHEQILELDLDALDLGEVELVEEVTGESVWQLAEKWAQPNLQLNQLAIKELLALVWLAGHRADPAFTLEDARRTRLSHIIPLDAALEAAGD